MKALPFETIVGRLHWRLAALRFQLAWGQFEAQRKAVHHSHYQPRVPARNPDGGQFTRVAGGNPGAGKSAGVSVLRLLSSMEF